LENEKNTTIDLVT